MPQVALFLAPLVEWLAKFFTDRAYGIAVASFFVSTCVACGAAIVGLVAAVSFNVPEPIQKAWAIVGPADWIAQVAVVVAIQATGLVHRIFTRAIGMAAQSK